MISQSKYDKLSPKFKSRIMKGVPLELRGETWNLLIPIDSLMNKHKGEYKVSLYFFYLETS